MDQSPHPCQPESPEPGDSSTDHLDQIALEPEPGGEGEGAAPGAQPFDGFIPLDAFTEGFGLTFAMIGELTALETLKAVPSNPTTPGAAKAIYETCREIPYLQWLVRPESTWMQRTMAIGAFAVPLALGCQMELKGRRTAKPANQSKASAAPAPAKDPPPADGAVLT